MKKHKKITLDSKRLSCLELQIFTYLGKEKMTIENIKKGFYGIASIQTIKHIVNNSPFFNIDNDTVEANFLSTKANITYDFNPDSGNWELEISGQSGKKGTQKELKNVDLYGRDYFIPIRVDIQGLSKWKLNITKIQVTDVGDNHERIMIGNPLFKSGSYDQNHKTLRK